MSAFTAILRSAFDWTWQTSLRVSVLIILVLAMQRLLRCWLTPRLRYALSLLVFCRLLLPVAPSSSLSFENLIAPTPQSAQSRPSSTLTAGPAPESATLIPAQGLTLGSILCVIWFSGLLLFGGLGVWRYWQWRLRIRAARQVSDASLLRVLDDVRREVGIRRPVRLASLAELGSPAVFGFWRLHLLLPETSLKCLSDQEWRLVFLHEMTHVRNHDTILNIVLIGVQILHWFNPLVWIGLRRLRADRELVCDAIVVERLAASERLGYAQVLLKLVEALSNGPRAFPSAVPVVSGASEIKTRVSMIKYYRESSRAVRMGVVICIVLLAFLTFTRAREEATQIESNVASSQLSGTALRDAERAIMNEFKTAGYILPESVVHDLVQETIKKEYGDRATQLPLRNITTNEQRALWFDWYLGNFLMTSGTIAFANIGTNQAPSRQKVDAIEIRYVGPKNVEEKEVRLLIRAEVGKEFKAVEVDDDIRNLYATGLFYNVRVFTEFSAKGVDLIYSLQCNPRIAALRFTGNSKISGSQLQKLIRTKVGDAGNERKIFADTKAIQKAYEHAGYQSPGVKYSYDIDQQTGKASVTFVIEE